MKMTKIYTLPKIDELHRIIENSIIGKKCVIWPFVNIYNAKIGNNVNIGSFAEIQEAKIGSNNRIGNGVFIPSGIIIGNYCFIGPKVCFSTDKYPDIKKNNRTKFYPTKETIVEDGVIIGVNSTILPGIHIYKNAVIGAGSVVTKDIPSDEIWVGNPAKFLKRLK